MPRSRGTAWSYPSLAPGRGGAARPEALLLQARQVQAQVRAGEVEASGADGGHNGDDAGEQAGETLGVVDFVLGVLGAARAAGLLALVAWSEVWSVAAAVSVAGAALATGAAPATRATASAGAMARREIELVSMGGPFMGVSTGVSATE